MNSSEQLKSLEERVEQESTTVSALRQDLTDKEDQLKTATQAHTDVCQLTDTELCLSVCLFVCLFVCLSVRLLARLFVCLFVSSFVCSIVWSSRRTRTYVNTHTHTAVFVCLFVCLSVCSLARLFVRCLRPRRCQRRRYVFCCISAVFVCPFVLSSGQILLPRYLMNGLSNLDETYSE